MIDFSQEALLDTLYATFAQCVGDYEYVAIEGTTESTELIPVAVTARWKNLTERLTLEITASVNQNEELNLVAFLFNETKERSSLQQIYKTIKEDSAPWSNFTPAPEGADTALAFLAVQLCDFFHGSAEALLKGKVWQATSVNWHGFR